MSILSSLSFSAINQLFFVISFNQLQDFNVNVLKWPRLTRLVLEFNNITVAIDIVYLLPVVFAAPEH